MRIDEIFVSQSGLLSRIQQLKPELIKAAQRVYDAWELDEDGYDPDVGSGGICHLIADEICSVLYDHDIDCLTQSLEQGEVHVWTIAYDEETEDAIIIDIPPRVYETGGGYTWEKIPNVTFDEDDMYFDHTDWENVQYELDEY